MLFGANALSISFHVVSIPKSVPHPLVAIFDLQKASELNDVKFIALIWVNDVLGALKNCLSASEVQIPVGKFCLLKQVGQELRKMVSEWKSIARS